MISAGFGYTAPSTVGAGLAVAGLVALGASAVLRRREQRRATPSAVRSGEVLAPVR